ncbi:hypothetical protein EUX98_g7265 [Antrodiella citrinella]|uniref:U3 small nucleolar RNA-associated protein 10 n=1 Tax=Antrodiella citrinella TaxID=2447956 RepID=A0A4S4MNP4_9APHY|nr:hypothetical protein EUX98_g7265 [Antrodiella citrinella]
MPTSLAQQLAQTASLNSALGKEADQHDLDSIHALGVNGFLQLTTLDPDLRSYETKLFSDSAKVTDRTLQPGAVNAELDTSIDGFLPLLGPFLMEIPTGKVIEWLDKRVQCELGSFSIPAISRISTFREDAVYSAYLVRLIRNVWAGLGIDMSSSETSPFAALLPYKSSNINLSRAALVNIMLSPTNSAFARFVAGLLPATVHVNGFGGVHRALVAFHTGILFDFVKRSQDGRTGKGMVEGTAAWYLPAVMEPMQSCGTIQVEPSKESLVKEIILSSFLLLSALSHATPLSVAAISAILKGISLCAERVPVKPVITSLIAVCAGQDEFPADVSFKSVVRAITKLDGVDMELKACTAFVGSETLLSGILVGLSSRINEDRPFSIILSLLSLPSLPSESIFAVTSSLITQLTRSSGVVSDETKPVVDGRTRALLVQAQQRHPDILQKCFDRAMTEDAENKEALEQALLSLSLVRSNVVFIFDADIDLPQDIPVADAPGELDMVVASSNADGIVRAIAVRDLFARLTIGGLSDAELSSVRSALLTRVQDTNASVLEALYAESSLLLPVVLENLDDFIQTLARAIQLASKAAIKSHFTFVAKFLYPAVNDRREWQDRIFHEIFFPFLLYSKSRQRAAVAVWEIIEDADKGVQASHSIGRHELLGGCIDAVRWQEASASQEESTGSAKLNLAIAGKIAENIVTSESFPGHLDTFLRKLQSDDIYIRALAYLVLRDVLGRLSGELQTSAGFKVVQAIGVVSLADMCDLFSGVENVSALLDDASLAHVVYSKPNSRNTLFRLQSSILVLLPSWPRRSGVTLDWVATDTKESQHFEYVQLMRQVYRLANSSASVPALSSHLMRSLFISLADDTLSFLAGIWLNSPNAEESVLAYVSLYHAAAFLEAYNSIQHIVDFQTVLPAILVSLQHADRRVREAALQCVAALNRLSVGKKPKAVYAYDAIYGTSSSTLLYLDWADFTKYTQALNASAAHFLNDATFLSVFQQNALTSMRTDSKKESGFKQRVLSCLLSHVNACPILSVKISLLRSVEGVSSPTKLQMLLPAIESLAKQEFKAQGETSTMQQQLATLLVSSIDGPSLKTLNEAEGAWEIYKSVVHHYFQPGSFSLPREALSARLRNAIFSGLTLEQKIEVCEWFLRLGQGNADISTECRVILTSILGEVDIIVQLLSKLQPTSDASQRATKRSKIDESIEETSNDSLSSLSLLAEILGSQKLLGSVELISSLLETLTRVVHDAPPATGDQVFVEQVLMSALENVALSIPEGTNMPATVRLDILVELIRVSENPQTFNQALLLTATLARLAPNAILHNIMPIFTFMGSNVFHRDDSYSFRVVQKIITLLLELATPKDAKAPADDIMKTARLAIENALRAMSAKDFVQSVLVVVESGVSVQEGALELLSEQLSNVAKETRTDSVKTIVKITERARKLLASKPDILTTIASFHAVSAIANTMCSGEESVLTSVVPIAINYVREDKCTSQALMALLSLTHQLGPRVIPYFKDIVSICVGAIRDVSNETSTDDETLKTIPLGVLQALLKSIPKFWGTAELLQVINLYLSDQSPELSTFMKAISKKSQSKVILPLLCDLWSSLSSSRNKTTQSKMVAYFEFLKRCIRSAPRDIISANIRALFSTFLDAFHVCASVPELLRGIKDDVLSAFLELVVKLNEATFKPLFRKMFDWAFASDNTEEKRPLIVIYMYGALLEYFKGLMTPYMSLLLQPFLTILGKFKDESYDDETLWTALLSTSAKTFVYDEGVFWREDRFKQFAPLLVSQVTVAARLNTAEAKTTITDTLLALTEAVQGDFILKTINLNILMQTRSDDTRVRALALSSSEALWRSHGGKLMGFVPETATFIAEAAEDANDTVVMEAHRLKNAVQNLAGNIDV